MKWFTNNAQPRLSQAQPSSEGTLAGKGEPKLIDSEGGMLCLGPLQQSWKLSQQSAPNSWYDTYDDESTVEHLSNRRAAAQEYASGTLWDAG